MVRKLIKVCALMLFGMMLVACGADDSDDGSTATEPASDAQPTIAVTDEEESAAAESPVDIAGTAAPDNIDMSTLPPMATPDSSETQSSTVEPGLDPATPAASPAISATPVDQEAEPSESDEAVSPAASPEAVISDGTAGDVAVGDGTTGAAVSGLDATPSASSDTVAAATPVTTTATPGATPESASGSATPAAPLAVAGCEVDDVPPFTGEQTIFSLTTDLNFRSGPGAECDLALDVPLGEFQQVTVIGGPVVRSDDDSEWVQIQVGETIGWVALEFLAPVE